MIINPDSYAFQKMDVSFQIYHIHVLRAVIIEELNFLNWEKKIPGVPEKHAGIIIEGGADLPFPPRFLKIG